MIRDVPLDGTPEAVARLGQALAAALDGGPTVLPLDAPRAGALRAAMAPDEPVEPDTAVIVTTSGSTGEPKGVLLSASALYASANATHDRLGGPGRWLLATPAQYIGGLQVLVRAMLSGTKASAVDLSVPFRSEPFAAAATPVLADDGPRYTGMVPTQLNQLLDEGGRGVAALAAFDAVIVGAAATPPELAERAADAGVRVVAAYGMSETASGCVYDGVPLAGVQVRLSDRDEHGVGTIEIIGPVLANGYRRAPDLTAQTFAGGWFHTGDAGELRNDRLHVLGRTDDLVNTGGVKVAPSVVERLIAAQPGVRAVCVVGVPDDHWGQVVVAAIVPGDTPVDREKLAASIRDVIRHAVGRAAVPKRIRFVQGLPLRGPGKVDQQAVRALLAR
jgi:O-succinylbenzoic acid--CoA ligase